MGDGKKQAILLCMLIILLFILLFLAGCQGKNLESITGGVVQEPGSTPNAQNQTSNTQPRAADLKPSCADSDNGDEPSVAGTVTVVKEGSVVVSDDTCTSEAELIEQYCIGRQGLQSGYTCKYGCREGRCLASAREQITMNAPPQPAAYSPPPTTQQPPLYAEQKEKVEEQIAQSEEAKNNEYQEKHEQAQDANYNCFNGFRDTFETDTDCGGACIQKCAYGKTCQDSNDCAAPLKCNTRIRKCMQRAY